MLFKKMIATIYGIFRPYMVKFSRGDILCVKIPVAFSVIEK